MSPLKKLTRKDQPQSLSDSQHHVLSICTTTIPMVPTKRTLSISKIVVTINIISTAFPIKLKARADVQPFQAKRKSYLHQNWDKTTILFAGPVRYIVQGLSLIWIGLCYSVAV